MNQFKGSTPIILLLVIVVKLTSSFVFAAYSGKNSCTSNTLLTSSQCETQDASTFFVLEALYADPKNPYPIELWEKRDNEQINIFDIAREIKSIVGLKERIFNNTDDAKRIQLYERLSQMEDIADRALVMEADKWKSGYVNELMKHIIGIRHAGISKLIPVVLDPANCREEESLTNPCDENGMRWTSFSSITNLSEEGPSIANYMQQHETDIRFISAWWRSQMECSWHDNCGAVKFFYMNQRTIDPQAYYWGSDGYKSAENRYSILWKQGVAVDDGEQQCYLNKEAELIRAFTIWHAYVQEVLTKSKFYHNDQINKQVCLTRTIGLGALSRNNITQIGKGYIIPSAAYDSFTLIKIFMKDSPDNKAVLESSVPHHRILHFYPLINAKLEKERKQKLEEEKQELAKFIVNNFYDNNGLLKLNLSSSSAINEAFEKIIFNQKDRALKNPFNNELLEFDLLNYRSLCFNMLSTLPEILKLDNLYVLLERFLNECVSDENDYETEFVVLSGPDLSFDYFYNTTDSLSHFEKRLDSGEGVCGFWPKLEDLKQIGYLGSSTGASLYQDSKGKKYVLKRGASEGHIREEFLADLFYARAGYAVPESRLYGTSEGSIKVASYLEDSEPLCTAYYNADEAGKQRLRKEVAKGFMIDALLANFDVIGFDMKNILVKNDGQVYRVDNSASFRYHTLGKLKNEIPGEAWNPSPIALWNLRDPNKNPNGFEIFSEVNIYEVAEEIMNYYEAHTINGDNAKMSKYCGLEMLVFNNISELDSQMKIRKGSFQKVAVKALEMKAQGLSPQAADIELRKWAEAEDWGPAFD